MGLNTISWRRIRTLNERTGEQFVHVVVSSHGQHWYWTGIRSDGSSAVIDTRDMTVTEEDPTDPDCWPTTTQGLLRDRSHVNEHNADWLRILDERAAELAKDRADG